MNKLAALCPRLRSRGGRMYPHSGPGTTPGFNTGSAFDPNPDPHLFNARVTVETKQELTASSQVSPRSAFGNIQYPEGVCTKTPAPTGVLIARTCFIVIICFLLGSQGRLDGRRFD
ncbi:hypothetical protein EVAR_27939_1 [Eumeta japonica]|uniref:Uncharacterized protein n=1 Tax=Eumeta variegata TaxID=151549 RepID=A0A4C1UV64_EUMVA|nr:hypothetical protein EVAR_27939_1 [Eumeta japonica]